MLYVNTKSNKDHTCGFYFGLEEYLIKDYSSEKDIFLLWYVEPTVMIGRHQVTTLEIDQSYVADHQISVVRRNSGGGAVYTDPGCLQFSFITDKKNHQNIFHGYVDNIVSACQKLGLNASFTGRNDILVDGKKFSGNAEYIYKDKMVVHGTILFESNLHHLVGSLTPDKSKLSKHAVSSVKSRVQNIGELLKMSLDKFYDFIVNEISTSEIELDELPIEKILHYKTKFIQDDWNYGKNPKYSITRKQKYDAGLFQLDLEIKKNIVQDMRISGDYFSLKKITDFENAFIGAEYTIKGFRSVLKVHPIKEYFYLFKTKDFLDLAFDLKDKIKRKPDYLKINMADLNKETKEIKALLRQHNLHTVCQEASCPNQLECFSNKTATFMILGTKCTRNCRFCDVEHGVGELVDMEEPDNIVRAIKLMKLEHVVITSVTRDDLPDYGSSQFIRCIELIKKKCPDTTVEVLIPDFMGSKQDIAAVAKAKPDVINHNLETIERLYKGFRHNASYQRSLELLRYVKEIDSTILTKSGIMVGIGETVEEVKSLMEDLRAIECDIITIGQYLQPSKHHAKVIEYIPLETFDDYKEYGKEIGFRFVASGPLVRSSYHAKEQFKGD